MKLNFDNKSFDIAISKNIEFVLGLTEAIAREHWDEVRNNLKCTYNNFFEMLAKNAAQAFRKAYFLHFDELDAKDDDSFKVLIEKFVGGHLLDAIHDLIDKQEEVTVQKSGSFGIGINRKPHVNKMLKNFNQYSIQIDSFLIQINIPKSINDRKVICKFIGGEHKISDFQLATGIIVTEPNPFDDECDLRLVFSVVGES